MSADRLTEQLRAWLAQVEESQGCRSDVVEVTFMEQIRLLGEAVARIEALEGAIDRCCQCRFEDGKQYEECHYHACERCVRTENGDPSEVTKDAEIERLRAALASAERREGEAVTLLRELEWALKGKLGGYCPVCEFHKDHGHAPDCRLAAALGKGEGK